MRLNGCSFITFGSTSAQRRLDEEVVKTMMTEKRTVCVGRLLIDLPINSSVSFTTARVDGISVNVETGVTVEGAAQRMAALEASLAGQLNEYKKPSLERQLIVDAINFKANLFYYDRTKPSSERLTGIRAPDAEEGITVEGFGLKDSTFFGFKGKRLSSPKYENNLRAIVQQFEFRPTNVVPSVPGFCTENGIVHDPAFSDGNETVAMFVSLKGHPDIAIRLDTSVLDEPQESFLARDAANDIKTRFASNIKNLRRGVRALNGIPGEEVLDRIKEENGTVAHVFMWESPGKGSDVLAPTVTLEMQTGKGRPGAPVNSSLSDEAALRLWDAISSSLRIRPNAAAPKQSAATDIHSVPLGTLAATGRTCPQTGFWQCTDARSDEDSRPKFFKQGDIMPRSVFRVEPTLWQKMRGTIATSDAATLWKLVAYGSAPE